MADSAGQNQAQSYGIDDLKDLFRKAKSVRERFIPDWYLNLAFYVGQQWCYWSRTGRLDTPRIDSWRELVTDNRIMPTVSSRAARKVKNRPQFVITPTTSDESDIDA